MDFLFRQPLFVLQDPRRAWKVRKVMTEYAKKHPVCEWDKKTTKIEVHHIRPVKTHPELAGDPTNMISLGARRNHLVIGHAGDWDQSVCNVRLICEMNQIVE